MVVTLTSVGEWVRDMEPIEFPNDVAVDSHGNITVVGGVGTLNDQDLFMVKLSQQGEPVWPEPKREIGDEFTTALGIAIDPQDNILVTGVDEGDLILIKLNPAGEEIWRKIFAGGGSERGTAVVIDPEGHIYVTGDSDAQTGDPNLLVLKYDPQGNLKWSAHYEVDDP